MLAPAAQAQSAAPAPAAEDIRIQHAVQTGTHRFYAIKKGEPDRLTETGQWKLARVLSYDHELAK